MLRMALLAGRRRGVLPVVSRVSRALVDERDIEEKFARGSGPGGQHVNKATNAVVLRHGPSKRVVHVHATRSLAANRTIARKRLRDALELDAKGADSRIGRRIVKAQRQKARARRRTRAKLAGRGLEGGE